MGSLFQTRGEVDEEDFEVALDVFLSDSDMVIEEEDCSDREGVYLEKFEQGTTAAGGAVP